MFLLKRGDEMWRMYGIEWLNYEDDPLTIGQVRDRFPGGFRIIRIDHGIAEITDGDAKHGWFADFRPVLGSVKLEPLRTLKRFHRKRFEQRFGYFRLNLWRYLYRVEISPLYPNDK